ncbi:MAG: hypothetical protein ACWGQW_12960, partial [bacterium]
MMLPLCLDYKIQWAVTKGQSNDVAQNIAKSRNTLLKSIIDSANELLYLHGAAVYPVYVCGRYLLRRIARVGFLAMKDKITVYLFRGKDPFAYSTFIPSP